ncbi:MAG: hypothetical protein HYZ50_23215 [Deltaproteobacteria bacterium]|nr:hypothetical protein [Deltaproteobacteria bacterium]
MSPKIPRRACFGHWLQKAFGVWIVGAYEGLIIAGEIHDVHEHPTIASMVGVSLLFDRP